MALADAGAVVLMSYRGKGLQRAAQKNRLGVERYAAEGRIAVELGSQVVQFEADSVVIALSDGAQKQLANDAAFVLIGADPPVQWLEQLGVRFVERPHQHQMGKTDDIVRQLVPRVVECAPDASSAAAQILGGSTGIEPSRRGRAQTGAPEKRGPRKWLRSATSIFSIRDRSDSQDGSQAAPPLPPKVSKGKKFEAPVPLSEFAKRRRRDSLTAGERTRILRMLRDEGGRKADEESQVSLGRSHAFDLDFDGGGAAPAPPPRRGSPGLPNPAAIVSLPDVRRSKRSTGGSARDTQPPPPFRHGKKTLPKPFEEPTRAVSDAELLAAVRSAPPLGVAEFDDQPTQMSKLDLSHLDKRGSVAAPKGRVDGPSAKNAPTFLTHDDPDDEATRLASIDKLAGTSDDRTRAVNIQHDSSLGDVDWDLD